MNSQEPQKTDFYREKYRRQTDNLFAWGGVVYWEYQPEKQAFDIPDNVFEHFGYTPQASLFTAEEWLQLIHPEDRVAAEKSFFDAVQNKLKYFDSTYRLKAANGEYRYFYSSGGWQDTRIVGILQDVTEKELAVRSLYRREKLLKAANTSANILLNNYNSDFDSCINEVLFLLCEATNSDRCGIWRNLTSQDEKIYTELIYEWSPNAEPQQNNKERITHNYTEELPFFLQVLQSGHYLNSYVKDLPEPERSILAAKKVVSVLIVPIIRQNKFWGFIAFDYCRSGQIWESTECEVIKSIGGIIVSIIKQKSIEKSLLLEQQTLNWVIDSGPDPIMISSNGVLTRVNKVAKKLFGCSVGSPASDIYPTELTRNEVLKGIKENGFFYSQSTSFLFLCKDGQYRDFMLSVLPFKPFSEKSLIFWATDVSVLKKNEKDLIAAKENAEEAVKVKSEFLARMSHEIRTPMNAVIGMIYLCMQTELAENQKNYLTKATTAANNLLGIINDILDFSKIEANRIELESIAFSIRDLVNEVSDCVSIQIDEKNLGFNIHIADDIDTYLIGDPLRLRQILINLLSNATKFTNSGGISVDIVKIPPDNVLDDTVMLKFSIKDTGIGIPEKQIDHIFDSFTQAEDSISRKFGGTGLGLAIVKRLVELMGGTIHVSSKIDAGSKFEFTALFSKTNIKPENSSGVLLNRKRVLVIDDDETSCEILVELMKSMGMAAEAVYSGASALERLLLASKLGHNFDLILVDWRMPRMDGIETIRQIHQQSENIPPLHILMVSAYDQHDCLRLSSGMNVAGVLLKPVNPAELKRALKQVFLQEAKHKSEEKKADIRGTKILLAEDNKINQMVAQGLLEILGVNVTTVSNGREAVEAVKNNDFDLVLMDVQMPEMDGLEATKIIRSFDKPGIDRLPILAMTANAMDSDYHKSINVGMNDHLTKPIDPAKLRLALEKWIQR